MTTFRCLFDNPVFGDHSPLVLGWGDEQLWPIDLALVVLGSFLIGLALAYLPLSGAAWYATAWPSLIGIPISVGAAMTAFRVIDNRLFRRSLQLSIVLCAIILSIVISAITALVTGGYGPPA